MSDPIRQMDDTPPARGPLSAEPVSALRSMLPRHLLNIALITCFIVATFWRVFFLGETFIDVSTLNNQLPWGYHAQTESDYPYNRRDLTDTYVTRDYFVVDAYRDGELPLWNPFSLAGHPIYADGVTRIFSPFLLFYKFFEIPLGYSLARIAELLIAAIFMYAFLVGIGVGPRGGLMGSLVFVFSSHSMFHLTGLGWWGGALWLPLILLFVDRAARKRSFRDAIFAGACIAAQFYCGWMQNQIYYLATVAVYYLYFGIAGRPRSDHLPGLRRRELGRQASMLTVSVGVGFVLSAVQWAPVMELLRQSNRLIVPTETGYIYLPPWYAATLIFPDLFGAAYDEKALNLFTALKVSHDHSLYLGIAALIPLGFVLHRLAISRRRGKKNLANTAVGMPESADRTEEGAAPFVRLRVKLFVILASLSLLVIMAAPLYVHLTRFIPVLQTIRVIMRGALVFFFAASVLVAVGMDQLLDANSEVISRFTLAARRVAVGVVLVVAGVIGICYALVLSGLLDGATGAYASGAGKLVFLREACAAIAGHFTPPDATVILPLIFVASGTLALFAWKSGRIGSGAFFWLIITVLIADLGFNNRQLNPTFDGRHVFPATEMTNLLKGLPPGRLLVSPSGLETNRRLPADAEPKIIAPPNTLLPYRIPAVTGKDQLFPKSYREYCSLIERQPNLSHVVFDEMRSPYLDLLNVRYLLTYESVEPPVGYKKIATIEGLALYENPGAAPRAFFRSQIVETRNAVDSIRKMRDPGFDPRTSVVVEISNDQTQTSEWSNTQATRSTGESSSASESSAPGSNPPTDPGLRPDQVPTIIEDKRNHVAVRTENPAAALLVLSDNYYPGWQVAIDGAQATLLKANHTMRAVWVPAGRHVVSFQFVPVSLRISMYISLGGIAAVAVALLMLWAMARRRAKNLE